MKNAKGERQKINKKFDALTKELYYDGNPNI